MRIRLARNWGFIAVMGPMRNFFLIFILGVCLGSVTVRADNANSYVPQIGFVLPLSGEWASLGEGIRDGALLAQQDLGAKGQPVKLTFEDNQGDLTKSVSIGKQLIDVQKVDATVSIISGVGQLLKPMATQAGIINIGICSETEVADGRHSFINYLTAEQGVAKFLQQFGQAKALGIFALNESGFQRIVAELKKQAGHKLSLVFEDTFDKGTLDFRAMLLRRKSSKPDAWLVLGLSPEIETLVKQARALGIDVPVTSIEGFGLASDKSPFEGAWFIDSAVPNIDFRNRFVQTYGREVTPGVGHAYDSVMLLASAFNSAELKTELDRKKVATVFGHISDFRGVTGNLTVRKDGVIWSDASVKVIKNGKSVVLAP